MADAAMQRSPLKILIVSSEITPFAKTGGLADVSAAISRYLGREGHDVRLMMPMYRRVSEGDREFEPYDALQDVQLEFGGRSYAFSVSTALLPDSDVRVMFLDCPELYDRDEIYTSDDDEHLRFALLARACLTTCQWTQWAPDIVHCNDWHTGLTPVFLKSAYEWDDLFRNTKTVLTIHNIGYQGVFPADTAESLGFGDHTQLFHQEDFANDVINFLKTGILYADALTTVSETYAREIQTPEFGMGLEELLAERSESLVGIVNGVDYGEWDPATDEWIERNYTLGDREGKRANRTALLAEFELEAGDDVPVFGIVSRLTPQKGFELLPDLLPVLLRERDMRFIVLGSGEEKYERYFHWLRDSFPSKVGFYCGYSERLSHQVEAGSDIFLMPSRYEPCGLNQMYSLRYGTVPIVRRVGGLADTVEDYDPVTGEGTGFVFDDFTSEALRAAIGRALDCYKDRYTWHRLSDRGMTRDFSWDRQGLHYVDLYERLLSR